MESALSPADSLWQFSTRFYADDAVAQHCLRLQNDWQFNVNYLLLALWHGLSGRGEITREQFNRWRNATQDLEQSISWLRMVRQSVKAQLGTHSGGALQEYYLRLREAELKGEQALQAQLAAWAQPAQALDAALGIDVARHSLEHYRIELDIVVEPLLLKELDALCERALQFAREHPLQ